MHAPLSTLVHVPLACAHVQRSLSSALHDAYRCSKCESPRLFNAARVRLLSRSLSLMLMLVRSRSRSLSRPLSLSPVQRFVQALIARIPFFSVRAFSSLSARPFPRSLSKRPFFNCLSLSSSLPFRAASSTLAQLHLRIRGSRRWDPMESALLFPRSSSALSSSTLSSSALSLPRSLFRAPLSRSLSRATSSSLCFLSVFLASLFRALSSSLLLSALSSSPLSSSTLSSSPPFKALPDRASLSCSLFRATS